MLRELELLEKSPAVKSYEILDYKKERSFPLKIAPLKKSGNTIASETLVIPTIVSPETGTQLDNQ